MSEHFTPESSLHSARTMKVNSLNNSSSVVQDLSQDKV